MENRTSMKDGSRKKDGGRNKDVGRKKDGRNKHEDWKKGGWQEQVWRQEQMLM